MPIARPPRDYAEARLPAISRCLGQLVLPGRSLTGPCLQRTEIGPPATIGWFAQCLVPPTRPNHPGEERNRPLCRANAANDREQVRSAANAVCRDFRAALPKRWVARRRRLGSTRGSASIPNSCGCDCSRSMSSCVRSLAPRCPSAVRGSRSPGSRDLAGRTERDSQ
jgi:hypothetical protein